MPSWRVTTFVLIGWTLAMAVWFVVYRGADATCGPEIYRNCQIGLKVVGGMGRPGIVVLWALGALALGLTVLTTSGPGGAASKKPAAGPLPAPLRRAVKLSAVVLPVAVVVGFATSTRTRDPDGPPVSPEGVRVQILSAALQRAVSTSRRRRNRARLSVHVRVTNHGAGTIANVDPVLLARTRLRPDPAAEGTTGSLLRPVPPGFTAGGTLRFETAGAMTGRLISTRRARLRIADQTVSLKLRIRSA